MGNRIQLQQRNCSDSHGISRADPLIQTRKELKRAIAACASAFKIYLIRRDSKRVSPVPSTDSTLNLLVTGGAGFIGSNLVLALQERFPKARLTVIDDFRSGDFKNLARLSRRFCRAESGEARLAGTIRRRKVRCDFPSRFDHRHDNHDQFVQVHDNVESFRRFLEFARPNQTRVIFASSASIYGAATRASVESNVAAPANIYAFSKAIMDNLATSLRAEESRIGSSSVCVTSMFTAHAKRTKACPQA